MAFIARSLLVSFLVLSASCTCGAFDRDTARFACATDGDCAPDFTCGDGECIASCTVTQVCTAGRECKSGRCTDVDECVASGLCGADTVCVNTPGSWECRCAAGFSGAPTRASPATCLDVDECPTQDCGALAECANTRGSFECSCSAGTFGATVTGGPTSCSTVDRCPVSGQCGANATCQSTATSFICTCASGYAGATTTGTPATCGDADECVSAGVCGPNAACTNTVGSFSCACPVGFTGPSTSGVATSCADVDECPTASCGANASCTNTPGAFTCTCDNGFSGAPVTGGPAVCAVVDNCSGIACGTGASCASGATGYTCTCGVGFTGAPVIGGAASCTDVDECLTPNVCGVNASCANTTGSYTCTCVSGFAGPVTTGMPATCVSGVVVLGTAEATSAPSITLTAPVALGEHLVLAAVMGSGSPSVTDSRGNVWVRVAYDSSCGACGAAGVWTTTVTTALQMGDTVTLSTSTTSAMWLGRAGNYQWLDTSGTYGGNGSTTMPSFTTNAGVLEPDELLVGTLVTRNDTALALVAGADGGSFTRQLTLADGGVSGIIGARLATALSGTQTFAATASPAQRFSGAMATFYAVAPRGPTALFLAHTNGNRGFTVSWTGGRGNGGATGCAVQVQVSGGLWTNVSLTNCDADAVSRPVNLPLAANWYGAAWSTVPVRLVRIGDSAVMGTFPASLTCTTRFASTVSTPTIDENCDGNWDDHTCSTWAWAAGTIYPVNFTACTNVTDTTTMKACMATNEAESRYTNGMSTLITPATSFSSSTVGTGCTGAFTGATTWTCTGSSCSWR